MENNNTPEKNKVYGLLLEINELFFLSVQYALSLEEAVNQAKKEFIKLNPQILDMKGSLVATKINLFTIKDISQLVEENRIYNDKKLQVIVNKHLKVQKREDKKQEPQKPVEIKKVELTEAEVKNIIMREIITNKDKNIFKQHKELFSKNEIKYLKDKLKKKDITKDLTSKKKGI